MTNIWEGARGLRDDGGFTEEMGEVVPRGWKDRAFRPEEVSASGNWIEKCWRHTTPRSPTPTKPRKTRKQVNRVRYDRYLTSLDGLPTHARPPEEVGPFEEIEPRECAKARQRSQSGPGATAWLRARPVDAQCVIPAQGFLYAGRRHMEIEEHLTVTCPACGAADANTRHARLCHRAGAQVN